MTVPAHRVLTLVRGMLDEAEAMAGSDDETVGDNVPVTDPNRAARVAAFSAAHGGEVG